jgi:hypothetical protein
LNGEGIGPNSKKPFTHQARSKTKNNIFQRNKDKEYDRIISFHPKFEKSAQRLTSVPVVLNIQTLAEVLELNLTENLR